MIGKKMWGAALAALAVCVSGSAQAAEKVQIILDFPFPVSEQAAIRLAQVKGWYVDAGYDVDIQMGKGSITTIQQVAAGQGDIGVAQLSVVAASISKGLPVISIMSMCPEGDLAVNMGKDTGYKTPKDLKGKNLIIPASGAATALLPSFLKQVGLTKDDVKVTFSDSTGLLGAFTAKQVDGVVAGAIYTLPRVNDKREAIPVYFADHGLNVPGYGLFVRKETVAARPDMLKKMMAIQQRAWKYIYDGHEQEGVDALVKTGEQFRPDPAALMAEVKLFKDRMTTPNTKGHPIGWQSDKDWEESLKILQSVEQVQPGWKVADYFDNQFVSN